MGTQSWFDFDQGSIGDTDRIFGMESQNQLVSKLHSILRPFLLRRQKKDVGAEACVIFFIISAAALVYLGSSRCNSRPYCMYRCKMEMEHCVADLDIPPKKELILYCRNSEVQHEVYRNIVNYRSITVPESSDDEEEVSAHSPAPTASQTLSSLFLIC